MTSSPNCLGAALLLLARDCLREELLKEVSSPHPATQLPGLMEPGASFVTLRIDDDLRGCIGSIEATRSLKEDVRANALASARDDPRFAPLEAHELERVSIEVSVLTPPEPLDCNSESELLARVRPGTDGLVIRSGPHRATLLPQVWESLPTPREFVDALWEKAGLEPGTWSRDLRVERYEVRSWSEAETPVRPN